MMFIMVTKKITAQHGPNMILLLGPRTVRLHVRLMRQAMREKSAKVKQLQGGKECRNNPIQDDVGLGEKQLQNIKSNSHDQELPKGNILPHKR